MDNYGYQTDDNNGRPFTISRLPRNTPGTGASSNYLVEVNSRQSLLKKPTFYRRLSLVCLILVVLLVFALIVLILLYVREKRKPIICTTDECLRSAKNLRYSMNLAADPCENFYEYSCGHWSKEHLNYGFFPRYTVFEEIEEHVKLATLDFLQSTHKEEEPLPLNQARILYKSCMDLDAREELGYSVIFKYLREVGLPELPSVFTLSDSEKDKFKFDWLRLDTTVKKMFSADVFFGFTVDVDRKNISNNLMYIGTPGQGCPLPSPFHTKLNKQSQLQEDVDNTDENVDETEDVDKIKTMVEKNMVKQVVKAFMKNLTVEYPNSKEINTALNALFNITDDINEVCNIAKAAAKSLGCRFGLEVCFHNNRFCIKHTYFGSWNKIFMYEMLPQNELLRVYRRISSKYHFSRPQLKENYTAKDFIGTPCSVQSLQEATDKFLSDNDQEYPDAWKTYLEYMFVDINVTLDMENGDMLHTDPTEELYLPRIISYLLATPDIYIEFYVWWFVVYSMIFNSTPEMEDYLTRQAEPFYPQGNVKSRSLDCAELVKGFMPYAVSYAIVDRSFTNTSKPKVKQMVNDIKDAFVQRVNELDWMDRETKKATLEKSEEMLSFIGYPNWLFKNGSLEEYYEGVNVSSDAYLENMVEMVKEYFPEKLESLRKKNKRKWKTEPITVNAFNSFDTNAINIPFAILSFPIYNLGLQSLQYGAIGSVVGHEFTHGFDNDGRKHDKYGNLRDWWANETAMFFEAKTKCFIKQYDNYTLEDVEGHVDGGSTLGENIADNGGINQAYVAFQNYLKRSGPEPKLPGFEYFTSNQLFFVAYASIWCESTTSEILKNQLKYDEHSPNSVRVLGTLQNSVGFAHAFKCPAGSKMNPDREKCTLW